MNRMNRGNSRFHQEAEPPVRSSPGRAVRNQRESPENRTNKTNRGNNSKNSQPDPLKRLIGRKQTKP